MDNLIVPEVKVLRSTIATLASRGVLPYQISPPSGQGIDTTEFKNEMMDIFAKFGAEPNFASNGPDIIGYSDSEYWLVECKGSGSGKPSTQRNNFDRALASTVSYYQDTPPKIASAAKVYLGLALPRTPSYVKELVRRVRMPLRKRLNLWVLLYELDNGAIKQINPDDEYKFA